jgi:hypothetical protein
MSRRRTVSIAIATLGAVAALAACSGGASATAPTSTPTPVPDANVAGDYVLTLTASQVCTTLADEARVTTYAAAITQTGTTIAVNVTGTVGNVTNTTTGSVRGDTVSLAVNISEIRASRKFYGFALAGAGTGSIAGNEIRGTVDGVLQFAGSGFDTWTCNATDHKFAFVRR